MQKVHFRLTSVAQKRCYLSSLKGTKTAGSGYRSLAQEQLAKYRSIFFKQPRDLVDRSKSNFELTDLHKTRITRDAADVTSLIALLGKQLD